MRAATECSVCASPRLAATRPSSSKAAVLSGWFGQNALQQFLKLGLAVGIALTLHFLRQQIHCAQIMGIDLDRFAEFDDGLGGIAAFAFEHPGQIVNLVILRASFCARPSRWPAASKLPWRNASTPQFAQPAGSPCASWVARSSVLSARTSSPTCKRSQAHVKGGDLV